MKVLVIGANGQVGHEIAKKDSGAFSAIDYPDIDLANPDSIREALVRHEPSLVINAAAYTAVDRAEREPELAMAVNGTAPGVLAEELARAGGALVHYSTEYVFDGTKPSPYTEDDAPNPLSAYGRSKLAGEEAVRASGCPHLIIRTSWLYGTRGQNFFLTMLRLARERVELRVVNDQIGAPTQARFVAGATLEVLNKVEDITSCAATYHLTMAGQTSWYGFARSILELDPRRDEHTVRRVIPVSSDEYPLPARRPLNCRLDCTKLTKDFGVEPPDWRESLAEIMGEQGLMENRDGPVE